MAKRNVEGPTRGGAAVADAPKTNALATIPALTGDMAVAAGFDANDLRGKEGLTQEDLILPRLAIAQKMSPELDRENAKFIEGLQEGDLFNTVTKENYGPDKRLFTIFRPVGKSAKVLDQEGNVIEWNVPFNDPRCEFTQGEGDDRNPPEATRFYDFFVLLHDFPYFPIVLSMKRTQVPVAKNLMTLMSVRPGPVWAGSYTVETVSQVAKSNGIKFKNFKVNVAGATPPAILELAQGWYEKLATTKFTVEQSAESTGKSADSDDVPF